VCLGTTYAAEPVCDDIRATLPLEVHIVTFNTRYYTTSPGRKKLGQLEYEIQRLTKIRHVNILNILAVKLTKPQSGDPPRLVVLSEETPALTLQHVLEDADSLREDRAFVSSHIPLSFRAFNYDRTTFVKFWLGLARYMP
jgi:eukaryotic translation initiation factor 2-alpha kinase 4